jgi:hypothetical protein
MAALRVNMDRSFIWMSFKRGHFAPFLAILFALEQAFGGFARRSVIVRKPHLIKIGDTTLTVSEAEIVMPSPSDQRPATGADILTRH